MNRIGVTEPMKWNALLPYATCLPLAFWRERAPSWVLGLCSEPFRLVQLLVPNLGTEVWHSWVPHLHSNWPRQSCLGNSSSRTPPNLERSLWEAHLQANPRGWHSHQAPAKGGRKVKMCQIHTVRFYQAPQRLDSVPCAIIYQPCELGQLRNFSWLHVFNCDTGVIVSTTKGPWEDESS